MPAFVLFAAALAATGPGTPRRARNPLEHYITLQPGTSWVYQTATNGEPGGEHRRDVVGNYTGDFNRLRDATLVQDSWEDFGGLGPYHSETYYGFGPNALLSLGTRSLSGALQETKPPSADLRLPIEEGNSWSWEGESGGRANQQSESSIESVEDVTLSGHTFSDCVKVKSEYFEKGAPESEYETVQSWFCPGVGLVKSVDEAPAFGIVLTEELTEFHSPDRNLVLGDARAASSGGEDQSGAGYVERGSLDGSIAWTDFRADPAAFPLVEGKGIFVSATGDGTITATSEDSGEVVWQRRLEQPIVAPLVVSGDMVLAGAADKSLTALDLAGGFTQWSRRLADVIRVAPVVAGGVVVAPVEDRTVLGLDAASGKTLWSHAQDGLSRTAAVSDGDTAYVADDSGELAALAPSGDVLWTASLSSAPEAGPVVAGGRVIVASERVQAFAASDGTEQWVKPSEPVSGLASDGEAVATFVGEDLRLLDAATGDKRWEVPSGRPAPGAIPLIVGDDVVVQLRDATIAVHDLVDGSQSDTIVPPSPDGTPISSARALSVVGRTLVASLDSPLGWPRGLFVAYSLDGIGDGVTFGGEIRPGNFAASSAPLLRGDDVIFPTLQKAILSLGPDGTEEPIYAGSSNPLWLVGADDVILANVDDQVVAVPAGGGEPMWSFDQPDGLASMALVSGDSAYVPVPQVGLFALDVGTGEARWAYPADAPSAPTPAAGPGGDVIFGSAGVARLDAATGKAKWTNDDLKNVLGVCYARGQVFVTGFDGPDPVIAALDAGSGRMRWEVPWAPEPLTTPVSDGDVLVVTEKDGTYRALDAASGEELWAVRGHTTSAGVPVIIEGAVVMGELGRNEIVGGYLYRLDVVDLRSGRFLGSFSAPGVSSGFRSVREQNGKILMPSSTVQAPGGVAIIEVERG